jgi:hypothetical protein
MTRPNSGPLALPSSLPTWLRPVMVTDRTLSAWFVGGGFGFAPLLIAVSPAPWATAVAVSAISAAALWLGLLGWWMAWGLTRVLRAGDELPPAFWASILALPPTKGDTTRDADRHGGRA